MNGYILNFEDVAPDIRVVTIQLPKDKPYVYRAGQYTMIEMAGEEPRAFSIANAPRADNTIDIHVRNSGFNLSQVLCSDITQGQDVYVHEPSGNLAFQQTHTPVVLLAGGTGITPFLAMIDEIRSPMTLYWGMNRAEDFYMDLRREGLAVHHCTDVYPIDAYLKDINHDAHVYLSGPPAMVKDSVSKLLAAGVEPSTIFYDE
jgi:CDP-4-dehydro-6-deoxyglucose reductase